jgi:uncharacterized membrane protein YgcG
MPDGYEISDGRFLQYYTSTSSLNSHLVAMTACPKNTVRTILAATLRADVDETTYLWFSILDPNLAIYSPITLPVQFATDVSENLFFPMLREGMEFKLFPGERLNGHRQAHTVGSSMIMDVRFIDSDLKYYEYKDPQSRLIQKRQQRSSNVVSGAISGGIVRGGVPVIGHGGSGGGGGGEEPV